MPASAESKPPVAVPVSVTDTVLPSPPTTKGHASDTSIIVVDDNNVDVDVDIDVMDEDLYEHEGPAFKKRRLDGLGGVAAV